MHHHLPTRARCWLLAVVAALVLTGGWLTPVPPTAEAVAPGDNGLIAFSSNRGIISDIYTMTAKGELGRKGRKPKNLTNDTVFHEDSPAWSPDGTRIVFQGHADGKTNLFVVDADGGNRVRRSRGANDWYPDWQAKQ